LNTIYAEFRTASSGSYGYSNPQLTAVDITLNATAPAVYLNSPTGILDPVSSPSLELAQQQWVNSDAGQWVTFSGAGSMGESMDAFTVAGCSSGPPCSPTLLTSSALPGTATIFALERQILYTMPGSRNRTHRAISAPSLPGMVVLLRSLIVLQTVQAIGI
jgi:hypothetical protein